MGQKIRHAGHRKKQQRRYSLAPRARLATMDTTDKAALREQVSAALETYAGPVTRLPPRRRRRKS